MPEGITKSVNCAIEKLSNSDYGLYESGQRFIAEIMREECGKGDQNACNKLVPLDKYIEERNNFRFPSCKK